MTGTRCRWYTSATFPLASCHRRWDAMRAVPLVRSGPYCNASERQGDICVNSLEDSLRPGAGSADSCDSDRYGLAVRTCEQSVKRGFTGGLKGRESELGPTSAEFTG